MTLLAAPLPDLAELERKIARYAPVELRVDTSGLAPGDRQALAKLAEAARLVDDLFLTQYWSGNHALLARLRQDTTPLGGARLRYFWINKSPWSALDDHQAFLPDVPPRKPLGANYYPEDMTRTEFEAWAKSHRDAATGFFTVIRRDGKTLKAVPYSQEYAPRLQQLAALLKEAAAATPNASLKKYLNLRADAFLSNDYYASDVAWMELDAPLDITIGPYETYADELFGYKAAFEAYITLRDDAETAKVRFFSDHLQEIENNLPVDPKYRNPKLGAQAPIRVVNQIRAAGDANHGVKTAAFNLPNDERVIREKGAKRVMLKNVQEAKFRSILLPIAARVLPEAARKDVSFDSFFTHILAHELSHGLGPHEGTRTKLKEVYGAIEEAKADVLGVFALQYMFDRKLLPEAERALYTSFLASAFRTLRFGLHEAHGRGMALQFNYVREKGGFAARPDGRFEVDFARVKHAFRELADALLTIEAEGDYDRAKALLGKYARLTPELEKISAALQDLPTDIDITEQK
jgi:hypothetical protein